MIVDQRLCGCGSGLRLVRCCQMDFSMVPPSAASGPLLPIVQRAAERHAQGAVEEAERLCLEVLELAPGQLEALSLLYQIRKAAGRENAAHTLLRRIVQLHPNTLWATHELALVLFSKGDIAEAETHARNAVRIAPQSPQSHNLMGMIMTEANRPQIGEYHYRKVIELSRARDPILLANLAWNLRNQGRMAESRQLYEESTAQAPEVLQTLLGWARLEEADRNVERAAGLLDRAERLAPGNPSIMLSRAVLCGRSGSYSQALAILDAMVPPRSGAGDAMAAPRSGAGDAMVPPRSGGGDAMAPPESRAGLGANELLEKGRLLDRIGRYDEAFAAFAEGKRLCREVTGLNYMEEQAQQLAARLKGFFTETRLAILPRARLRDDTAQPIFILGFPRSGTTLVEQTLSAHPRICAGDELPFVNEITQAMMRVLNSPLTYPEALAELWMGDRREGLDELRDYYLERVRQLDIVEGGAAWFTDKMPLNETHLGLIALMFPRSPIIHVLRHPLDVVLSTFSNHLTHGFYCSYALETAARHYALTMELVEHYRAQMTLRYLPIRYEDIVDDQEEAVRRMLDFIGEPFDKSCLAFHENTRYARTASYAQVTEQLYDRSRYRYRHYGKHLEPAAAILEPVIKRLGYSLD